jgi:hypothetical protein
VGASGLFVLRSGFTLMLSRLVYSNIDALVCRFLRAVSVGAGLGQVGVGVWAVGLAGGALAMAAVQKKEGKHE